MLYFLKQGRIIVWAAFFMVMPEVMISQSIMPEKTSDLNLHHEFPDDPYMPGTGRGTTPAYRDRGSSYFTIQVNVDEDGDNILDDAANEPSIAIDPANPDKIVIGWRQFDNVVSNFRQAGYAYTLDAGESWTFPGVIEPGVFRSDPVLSYDIDGNIYYNSLTTDFQYDYWCHVFMMEEETEEWDEGTYAYGGDKQWMTVDRTNGMGTGNIYSNWTSTYSICFPNFFTRSVDQGASFEACVDIPGDPKLGTVAVGAEGEVYVAGIAWEGFVFAKSYTAQDPDQMIMWNNDVIVDMGGYFYNGGGGPNPGGLLGQVWVDADRSQGPDRGNIYMLCSLDPIGSDLHDVMFVRSTDGGDTWSEPLRVNDDDSDDNWQWFGTMSVAPDGRIDVVWLDTRDTYPGSYESSLYYAYSVDGGLTFSANERLSESFDPHVGWPNQQKMGDYYHMISDEEGAHLAWANTLNGEQDVYYTHIDPWFVGVEEKSQLHDMALSVSPNPAKEKVKITYRIATPGHYVLKLIDIYGKPVKVLSDKEQETGTYTVSVDAASLTGGLYFCRLQSGNASVTEKITLVK